MQFGRFAKTLSCLGMLAFAVVLPARAKLPTLNGAKPNPPNIQTTNLVPPQVGHAVTATVVPVSIAANSVLTQTLIAQKFTNANNWTLNQLPAIAANLLQPITINTYQLSLNPRNGTNPGGYAKGTAIGEIMDFTVPAADVPAQPALVGALAGYTATLHWLQVLHESTAFGGFGNTISINGGKSNLPGFWQVDNGDKTGGAASGPTNGGPYYDSNAGVKNNFSKPPTFFDYPAFYQGVGTYLTFTAIPTWDLYNATTGNEIIDVATYGVKWGFNITAVPEPSRLVGILGLAIIGIVYQRRSKAKV